MKKKFLSIMLAFTMLAALSAAALPVSAALQTAEPDTSIEFVSDITVYESCTGTNYDENGNKYDCYDWFFSGIGKYVVNNAEGKIEWSGSPMRLLELYFDQLEDFGYTDTQATQSWEVGNTYDAQIHYSVLLDNGDPYEKTVDVKVTVCEPPVPTDFEFTSEIKVTADNIYFGYDDNMNLYASYELDANAVCNATIDGEEYADTTIKDAIYTYGSVLGASVGGFVFDDGETPSSDWQDGNTYDVNAIITYNDEYYNCLRFKIPLKVKVESGVDITDCEVVSVSAEPLTYAEHKSRFAPITFTATLKNGLTTTDVIYDDSLTLPSEVGTYTINVSVLNGKFTVPVSVTVTPTPTSGVWAEGFTWTYDKTTSTMCIKGTGELPIPETTEFRGLAIKHIVIDEGIESIEQWALLTFTGSRLETMIFPKTLKTLPALGVFEGDITINNVIFQEGITNITHFPFGRPDGGAHINNIYIPASAELVDVYWLIESAGRDSVFVHYAAAEEEWLSVTEQPTFFYTLYDLYNNDGSLQTFEEEYGYSFPTNPNNYDYMLIEYEILGFYYYEYGSEYAVTVTWVDENGATVETETLEYNKDATKNPAVPEKEGFTGKWSTTATNVIANVTIRPEYTINTYTVTWVDENDATVDTETVEYNKDATKTPAVPEKVGFTGKWSATAVNVKTNVTIRPEYTVIIPVENGTATIPDIAVDVTEGEDVVIDVTDKTEEGETKVESVVIGSATVDKIADANTNVEIKLPDATVSFDKDAISSIGEQAAGKDVTIVVKEVEKEVLNEEQKEALIEKEVVAVINLEAIVENTNITEFGGGKVTVSVPFEVPEGKEGSEFLVAYIADDGTMTVMPTSYANGALTFETTHFSSYVVLEVENDSTSDTGDSTPIALFVMLIALSGIALASCVTKRKAF